MTLKRKIDSSQEDVEFRYANWLKQVIDLVAPKNLYAYIGRAGGKTTDILAERSMEIVYDMPGAYFAWVADTYLNAIKNVIPSLVEGWKNKGWIEGVHFVVDEQPPAHFLKPYKKPLNYKHTLSTFNGCLFKLVSMDRPSTGAGDSYQHLFGDEAKYLKEKKLNKLTPAIRGESVRFFKSPYYRGHSFTSDLANPMQGEDDWMWKMAKKMDKERIELILQCSFVVQDIKKELYHTKKEESQVKVKLVEKKLERWEERLRVLRKNSTFFYVASSYINADILTIEFFEDLFATLDFEEAAVSVLSIKPRLEKGARFYINLDETHFYDDGISYPGFYDKLSLKDTIKESCVGLKYLDSKYPIEAGFDAGNQMSLVTGQTQGETVRVLKNFATVTPKWIEDLAKEFLDFYEDHPTKVLELYYDRSANAYSKAKKDFATQLQKSIEESEGKVTGWVVRLMSRDQGNITHSQEYDLCLQLMGRTNPNLPNLQIDLNNCRELKSSMELAPVVIKEIGGSKSIQKDKSSEKLKLSLLIMKSTNLSDAFKYFICRPEWLRIAEEGRGYSRAMADPRSF